MFFLFGASPFPQFFGTPTSLTLTLFCILGGAESVFPFAFSSNFFRWSLISNIRSRVLLQMSPSVISCRWNWLMVYLVFGSCQGGMFIALIFCSVDRRSSASFSFHSLKNLQIYSQLSSAMASIWLIINYGQYYLSNLCTSPIQLNRQGMQSERDQFECSEEIIGPIITNGVPGNSNDRITGSEELAKQEEQAELSDQILREVLKTAYHQLKDSHFMDAVRTMNSHSKGVRTEMIDWRLRLCFFQNMACAYQGLWNLQMCDSTCEVAEAEINILIQQIQEIEEKIRLQLILLILRMQHCAIYSQMGVHQKALATAQQNLQGLKQCLSNILLLAAKINEKDSQKGKRDYTSFSFKIQRHLELLKSLIKDLEESISIEDYDKRPIFYNWKNNPETNQKLIRQAFASKHVLTKDQESRTLLGLQKQENAWISEFNIGSIMHMTPVKYEDLYKTPSIYDQLVKKKLYEKVIYASVLHFTIATQMRFMDAQNSQSTVASVKFKAELSYRSKTSRLSELHHLKAIQLMCKGISTKSPYLNHLINSYHKHYMQTLICINEEESMVSEIKDQKEQKEKDQDYFRGSVGNVLSQPAETPMTRKLKQIKSTEYRGTSRSMDLKKRKKSAENSLKNIKTAGLKSPMKEKQLKKKPSKLTLLKNAISAKDCELRLTTRSQTQIKVIMNRKNK